MRLSDIDKTDFFKVPEKYFDEFPDRLNRKIEARSEKREIISLSRLVELGVAAVIALIVTFSYQVKYTNDKSAIEMIEEVPVEALIAYLEETGISTDEVLETIDLRVITQDDEFTHPQFIPENELDEETIDELMNDFDLEVHVL